MTILLDEIKWKKQKILNISSPKEKYFYHFLRKDRLKYCPQKWDLDDFVVSVFGKNSPKKHPKKHWTDLSNIDLFAIAEHTKSFEKIEEFAKWKSIKYAYILKYIFNRNLLDSNLPLKNNERMSIDILINAILNKEITIDIIIKAVNGCEDLIDIYIIEEAFKNLCEVDKEFENKQKFIKRNRRYSLFFWSILIVFIYIICITSDTLFMKNLSDILVETINQIYTLILKVNKRIVRLIVWLWVMWLWWKIILLFPKVLWFILKKDYTWEKRWQRIRNLF